MASPCPCFNKLGPSVIAPLPRFLARVPKMSLLAALVLAVATETASASLSHSSAGVSYYTAYVNITFFDAAFNGVRRSERKEMGRYGVGSRLSAAQGWVVHVRDSADRTDGCHPAVNAPTGQWIALVARGACKFNMKIYNAAILRNASAVVIYNDISDDELITMDHDVEDVVSVFVGRADGVRIARLADNGSRVLMRVSVGDAHTSSYSSINKTSVLFVSVAFIVLMVISLAWLVFYYVQRFRYAHAKDRLSNRLMHAAKKAISKMPTRTLKTGDKETDCEFDQCAVCIEIYKVTEQIRILPCKHLFHKLCVDPWLLEQRSCPMCKQDILKPFGLHVSPPVDFVMVSTDTSAFSVSVSPSTSTAAAIRHQTEEEDSPPAPPAADVTPPAGVTAPTAASDSDCNEHESLMQQHHAAPTAAVILNSGGNV